MIQPQKKTSYPSYTNRKKALHNNREMNLVLSSNAKPRLKWTQELHQRFVDAVNHLGGAEKATPKSLMRVMGIDGLSLYHIKSHLQKYRLGKSQQSQTYHQNKEEENGENQKNQSIGAQKEINNESLQVAQALQMQMDVQKKLLEQLDVQRHLQLRIEAQGKYLQSVLKKAQETLSGYTSCSTDQVEQVKAQLSQLVSMVDSGCPSSSFSVLTESDGSMLKNGRNKMLLGHNGYSVESSLTSSDSSGRKEEIQTNNDVSKNYKRKRNHVMLSLMEMHPEKNNIESDNRTSDGKRSKNGGELKKFDLNCKSTMDEFDSGTKVVIDLNCTGVELFSV